MQKKIEVSFEDFQKLDIRCGTVIKAENFDRTIKPAFKVWVDFGPKVGILQTSAQITRLYQTDGLPGKQVIGCINIGPRNIAGFVSEFLLLGAYDDAGAICLFSPDHPIPIGHPLC